MADKYGRIWHSSYKPSVPTPLFSDINRYLPQPGDESILSPNKRRYPKPIASPSTHRRKNKNLSSDNTKCSESTAKSIATSGTPSNHVALLKGNVTHEQRSISVSTGEALYSMGGQDSERRPPKRRHNSAVTPGLQDEVPVEKKRARTNYTTPATNAARLLRFHPFNAEPPVFTVDTLTTEIQGECQKYMQTTETLAKKLKLKSFLERTLSPIFPGCSLHLCGSSTNGFGGNTSDADFCFILNHSRQTNNRREALPVLRQMQRLLNNDPTYSFLSKCSVIPASVPILKFMDTISGCECDVNINNTVGVRNTHLLRAYCGDAIMHLLLWQAPLGWFTLATDTTEAELESQDSYDLVEINMTEAEAEPEEKRNLVILQEASDSDSASDYVAVDYRVQPLVILVKKWAKKHDINDASQGSLSSYALTLMVIHYLQGVCQPAVVPVLQTKYPKVFKYYGNVSDLSMQDPCKHIDSCNKSENRQSLGELFVGLFKYYAVDYSWHEDYISIAMGAAYPRYRGQWQRKHICIEEPFDGNNVAKAVCSLDMFNKIHMKFRLAWHTLKISPSLESIKVT